MSLKNNKVVVIGLDGATWKILMPWIKQGKLPFFKKLIDTSLYGDLESTIPPLTAPAWVSFQTGVNPGKHGVFNFVEYNDQGEEDVVNSNSVKAPRIWEILEKHGKSCCIINMPVTYPPPKTKRSIIVSSFLTPPGKPYTSPLEIQKELEKLDYKIDILFEKYGFLVNNKNLEKIKSKLFNEILLITKGRIKAINYLMNKRDWDLFFVLFKETDLIQHIFWNNVETLRYYRFLDKYLQNIYKIFANKYGDKLNFFIISDHGFDSSAEIQFSIYPWLNKEGFIKYKQDFRFKIKILKLIYKIIKKSEIKLFCNVFFLNVRDKLLNKELTDKSLNLRRNKSIWVTNFGIYLNNKDNININYLIKKIKKLKFKGKSVFKSVYEKYDLYDGPYLNKLPDIIFTPNSEFILDPNFFSKKIFSYKKQYLMGNHLSDNRGIFVYKRNYMNINRQINKINLTDLVPIINYVLSISDLSYKYDGKVPKELKKYINE